MKTAITESFKQTFKVILAKKRGFGAHMRCAICSHYSRQTDYYYEGYKPQHLTYNRCDRCKSIQAFLDYYYSSISSDDGYFLGCPVSDTHIAIPFIKLSIIRI